MSKVVTVPSNSAPSPGCNEMTVGTAVAPIGRALLAVITATGNAVVQMADGSELTLIFPAAGIYEFNWVVTEIVSQTATGTYYQML